MGMCTNMESHSAIYLKEVAEIAQLIDPAKIEELANNLKALRDRGGRLFVIGVGGSAGNASHAVNDFRKLCGIEAYSVTDNISELTARANDEGWKTIFSGWLKVSNLNGKDAIFVLSVGGGDAKNNVSVPIIEALDHAVEVKANIFGIVGRNGGYTGEVGDCVIISPIVSDDRVTPHSEEFQGIIWHCLVSSPVLQVNSTKW
jgi:D-sedoheptulose 7-phosphate isomerase